MTHAQIARLRNARPGPQRKSSTLRRTLTHLPIVALVLGLAALSNAYGARDAVPAGAKTAAEAMALAQAPSAIWSIDRNGDGVTDYYNPTHSFVRGVDEFGSGAFGASRDGGKRKHEGVDYAVVPGAAVRSPIAGEVARLGYAYNGEGGYRVVEIVNSATKVKARVLYVSPSVEVGDFVVAGQAIGAAQDLNARYPGITNHVHVELRGPQQELIDAAEELPSPTLTEAKRALAGPRRM